ncbi:protein of unknown function DUF1800 [Pseudopedobacter saltans DSM 12145]|uniref:DUF1800 domain-containing protein n=1 Tax=Pseudopedobacter saltans (strain ATCC 51119 / DSM 12145 / JCM 21818 / CCUG 39354 / LMG 10337 / NBRC 100064 / NCIMB 13643) TaxID=762903 RepID=F0SA20_PSESL|nr:DUF1800 domain-containing protein [Pseudopedobacter saltans]ADY53584.1 protein of unknown function DUF1800 [Pseudopedobacter saltans DSM 12145]
MNQQDKVKHLYSRAGFGIHYSEYQKLKNQRIEKLVDRMFSESAKYRPLSVVEEPKQDVPYGTLTAEERRQRQREYSEQTRTLNVAFLDKLASDDAFLREKMTLFFHGHFACRQQNAPFYIQELNNIHRDYALGNFKALTVAVSQSRAMLSFLNNQQNRKGKPNENFARELMELFTLGVGHYTEDDIKASARAFTGWRYNKNSKFEFAEKLHDDGVKTFFGKKGRFNGQDIIDMIFEKKQTAYYISGKLYRFFVNETPNEAHIKELGDYFYSKNYELKPVLKKMFTADWFYDDVNVGNKIKTPIEFIAGLNRQFYIDYENKGVLLRFQQALGQTLFYPPNVSGWPLGKDFIDSSSLMLRLKMPSTILNNGILEVEGKADPDDEAILAFARRESKKVAQRIKASADWDKFSKNLPEKLDKKDLAAFLLRAPISPALLSNVSESTDLKTKVVQLLSTPEYQMC